MLRGTPSRGGLGPLPRSMAGLEAALVLPRGLPLPNGHSREGGNPAT
jgi:hypothetical protein